jgi:DNA-binding MarR family transcriptional regulator
MWSGIDVVNIDMRSDARSSALHPFEDALAESGGDPAHAAYLALTEAAAALQKEVAELVAQHGLSLPQYSALRAIRRRDKMRLAELAEAMVHRAPDASRLIDRLVRVGFVSRQADEVDRRAVRLRLTKRGQESLAAIDRPLAALHRRQFAEIEARDVHLFTRFLLSIARAEGGSTRSS